MQGSIVATFQNTQISEDMTLKPLPFDEIVLRRIAQLQTANSADTFCSENRTYIYYTANTLFPLIFSDQ